MDEQLEFPFDEGEQQLSIDDLVGLASGEKDDEDLSDDLEEEDEVEEEDLGDEEEEEENDDPSDEEEEEEDEDPDVDDEDNDETDEEEEAEPFELPDDAEISVKVNGEDIKVSGAALKRLAGQEAALTQRSQALNKAKTEVENHGLYIANVLQTRYAAAKANADRYKNVDLFDARTRLDDEDFEALRSAKEAAEAEVKAIETEANEFIDRTRKTREQLIQHQAREALKVLHDKIPEWSDEVYADIRNYAVKEGMDPTVVNETVDPSAIIMMRKAMLYDKLQESKSKVTEKAKKAPKKVSKKSSKPTNNSASKLKIAQRKVAENGGDIDSVLELAIAASQ